MNTVQKCYSTYLLPDRPSEQNTCRMKRKLIGLMLRSNILIELYIWKTCNIWPNTLAAFEIGSKVCLSPSAPHCCFFLRSQIHTKIYFMLKVTGNLQLRVTNMYIVELWTEITIHVIYLYFLSYLSSSELCAKVHFDKCI